MGLLTTEYEIALSNNIKYYEELGYIIPRRIDNRGRFTIPKGSKLMIKIKDIPKNSHVKVEVICDGEFCINPISKSIIWEDYTKTVHADGKYYCKKCASRLFGGIKSSKTKLLKSISFEKWCIDNDKQHILNMWDFKLNKGIIPSEISYRTKKKYYFKCSIGIHKSELQNIVGFTSGQEGSISCKACNSFAQWGINNICEDFLDEHWSNKNTISPWEISYGSKKSIWLKCKKTNYHGDYPTNCLSFINELGCSYCGTNGILHINDSLGFLFPEVLEVWSDKNIKSSYEYSPYSGQEVYWKCFDGKHEDYKRSICSSNICNFRCPSCSQERNESYLQEKVRLNLEMLKYTILHESNCTLKCINPKTKCPLPYDNEVEELKLIIEVHGVQHYHESNGKWFDSNFNLYKRQLYDRYKRIYAKLQGYHYLEIPYYTDNKSEEWKQLIDNKISQIKYNIC